MLCGIQLFDSDARKLSRGVMMRLHLEFGLRFSVTRENPTMFCELCVSYFS